MYKLLFALVLRRLPAETAHRLAFGLLRALTAVPGVGVLARRLLLPTDPALQVRALGLDLPGPLGLAAGFDKDAARSRRDGGPRLRLRRGRHAHGRAPARQHPTPDVPACPRIGPWSTGWDSTTTEPTWPPAGCVGGRPRRRRHPGRGEHRQDQGRPGCRRDRRLRTQCGRSGRRRRLPRGQRQFAQHTGSSRPAGRGPPQAAPGRRTGGPRPGQPAARTPAGEDRPRPCRRGHRRGRGPRRRAPAGRHHRHQHHDRPVRSADSRTPRSTPSVPAGCPALR